MTRSAAMVATLIAVLELIVLGLILLEAADGLAERSLVMFVGQELWGLTHFFTDATNLLAGAIFAHQALRRRYWSAAWLGGVTVWMVALGFVYFALLAGPFEGWTVGYVTDMLNHLICPALVLVWWICFAPKEGLGWRQPVIWLGWPLLYLLAALARGAAGGGYPYYFLDVGALGAGAVALWVAALMLVFLILGYALVIVARWRVTVR